MRTSIALLLLGCSATHTLPMSLDAGADAGTDSGTDSGVDAGRDAGPCEPGLALERGRCVGWRQAASLPDSVNPPELVMGAHGGTPLIRLDGTVLRYVESEDRFAEVDPSGAF